MPRSTLLLTLLLLTGSATAADPELLAVQEKMRKLIERAEPSVVSLVVSTNSKHAVKDTARPWVLGDYPAPHAPVAPTRTAVRDKLDLSDARNAGDYTIGSGVVLDADAGLILTCYHLIDGARKVYARGVGGMGSYADIVAADARSDLAVLRMQTPSAKLASAKLADVRTYDTPRAKATVFRGLWVVSLAHPFAAGFGDGQPSASWGIVGNVARKTGLHYQTDDPRAGYLYQCNSLIQTDARLNLGCSGGGLFNLDGDLIAITSTIAGVAASESAGGFAIPMDGVYRGIVDVLKTGGEVEYGFIGITPGGMTADDQSPGLLVTNVAPGSPAFVAGLLPGDVVLAVNGRPVRDDSDLFLLVGGTMAGREATFGIRRNLQRRDIRATLAKYKHNFPRVVSVRPEAVHGLRVEYSSILAQEANGPGVRAGLHWDGVVVHELVPGSRAEAAFKEQGLAQSQWVITKVNDTPTPNPPAFYAAARTSGPVRLTLVGPAGESKAMTLP